MRERGGKVKVIPISKTDRETLQTAIKDNVHAGSTIYTDGFRSYIGIDKMEYRHKAVKHSAKEFVAGMGTYQRYRVCVGDIKAWYHRDISQYKHQAFRRCVDEFSFRLNEGNCEVKYSR